MQKTDQKRNDYRKQKKNFPFVSTSVEAEKLPSPSPKKYEKNKRTARETTKVVNRKIPWNIGNRKNEAQQHEKKSRQTAESEISRRAGIDGVGVICCSFDDFNLKS